MCFTAAGARKEIASLMAQLNQLTGSQSMNRPQPPTSLQQSRDDGSVNANPNSTILQQLRNSKEGREGREGRVSALSAGAGRVSSHYWAEYVSYVTVRCTQVTAVVDATTAAKLSEMAAYIQQLEEKTPQAVNMRVRVLRFRVSWDKFLIVCVGARFRAESCTT
jgi:hypothetical protein